jgi:hypothetical protein
MICVPRCPGSLGLIVATSNDGLFPAGAWQRTGITMTMIPRKISNVGFSFIGSLDT